MATAWSPRTRLERKTWLLANGEVVTEPALEESPTGKKVRVAGTELSVYEKDLDQLVRRSVASKARQMGTDVWMPLTGMKEAMQGALGYDPAHAKASVHFLDTKQSDRATRVWWRFKHSTLPIEAVLSIVVEEYRNYYHSPQRQQTVRAVLVTPDTTLDEGLYDSPRVLSVADDAFTAMQSSLTGDAHYRMREFVRDTPPEWDASILGSHQHDSERLAVIDALAKVRVADDLPSIQVPDLRDPMNPAWLDLELYETNCNGALVQDLADYLDGTPNIDLALHHYTEMLKVLRGIGIVMEGKNDNDFMAALLAGDKNALTVALGHPQEEGFTVDARHTLSLHLPTGTFVVQCNLPHQDTIAEKWEEARTIAQFTGEEDELLAYAKEYVRRKSGECTKKIIKERRVGKKIE